MPEIKLNSNVILQNERALLRPLTFEDIHDLDELAQDRTIFAHYPDPIKDSNDLVKYVAQAMREKQSETAYPFIIIDKATNKMAGTTRYANISSRDKRLEIGWTWLGKDYRGTGLNKACKFELLSFAFDELGFNRVEFKTDALNTRSRKAMMKIGAKEEGTWRSHTWMNGQDRYRDTVYYSILKDEWDEIRSTIFKEFI